MRILGRWLINSLILFVLPYVLPGISVSGFGSALAMALVLGLINTFLFWLASEVVHGYNIANLPTAFLASLLFSLAATFLRRVV
jgi:uncharacterized membrane protein YvlD (DUF360 family)